MSIRVQTKMCFAPGKSDKHVIKKVFNGALLIFRLSQAVYETVHLNSILLH